MLPGQLEFDLFSASDASLNAAWVRPFSAFLESKNRRPKGAGYERHGYKRHEIMEGRSWVRSCTQHCFDLAQALNSPSHVLGCAAIQVCAVAAASTRSARAAGNEF